MLVGYLRHPSPPSTNLKLKIEQKTFPTCDRFDQNHQMYIRTATCAAQMLSFHKKGNWEVHRHRFAYERRKRKKKKKERKENYERKSVLSKQQSIFNYCWTLRHIFRRALNIYVNIYRINNIITINK